MFRFSALVATGLLILPFSAHAASLYIDPDMGMYGIGDTIVASIRLNTDGECMNAADITLSYPKESLKAVDFGRGSSIITLWVVEPSINHKEGTVHFAGGIPGGYCGRIEGDPSLSNILGKAVFTVTSADVGKAGIRFESSSALYANDGLGTKITPTLVASSFKIVRDRQQSVDPWLDQVNSDTALPDSFTVQIESTKDVFGGEYYVVFSTVDKQSGMDHFEIFERGAWNVVKSPYRVIDQSLSEDVQIRAIDKAGNIRHGIYEKGSVPLRQTSHNVEVLIGVLCVLILAVLFRVYIHRQRSSEPEGSAS